VLRKHINSIQIADNRHKVRLSAFTVYLVGRWAGNKFRFLCKTFECAVYSIADKQVAHCNEAAAMGQRASVELINEW